jgi:inner membrane protein
LDNLTHSLVGLFLGRMGLRKLTPNGLGVAILAANAPDFDVISWFWGREEWLRWHRNFTHALLGLPLMALVTILIIRVAGRKPIRWWPAFLLASIGIASHIILDLTNVYGVRLLLPFSGQWFHWDTTPVLDLTIWAMLLVCAFAPMLARLVSSEIGARRSSTGAGWAMIALLALGAYDYARTVFHERAVNLMASRIWNGLAARRAGAFPQANPLLWTGIVELSNAYVTVPIDLRAGFHPLDGVTFYKATRGPAAIAAMETRAFEAMQQFVQYPLWIVEPGADPLPDGTSATRVVLMDLRFGSPAEPGFNATAMVDDRNRVLESFFAFGGSRPR